MGFFKDVNNIQRQAKEMGRTSDPGARFREMNDKMRVLNDTMAQSTSVLTAPPGASIRRDAQILSVAPTTSAVNGEPIVTLGVLLLGAGAAPIPVTTTLAVPVLHLHRLQPGASLPVSVSVGDPVSIVVDWSALSGG